MTYLVTEDCINCKHSDCVSVCPVDCFHEGPNFISIDPDECIDCGICLPECPVNAIVADADITDEAERKYWYDVNYRTSKIWPITTVKQDPLPDHEAWAGKPGKRDLLQE